MMRQWTTLMDGIDKLKLQQVPQPQELKSDEVLVKISRVALNYRDSQLISGAFKGRYAAPESPLVPCSDAAGTIAAVGPAGTAPETTKWQVGQRVLGLVRPTHSTGPTRAKHHASGLGIPGPGVLAEYHVFAAGGLLRVPDYMSLDEACTLPIASVTAWMALNWDRQIGSPRSEPQTTVLIQGTGGVAIAALQQAHALGLRTIVTSSSDAKLQRAKELGADHAVNYSTTPEWADEVLRLTDGKGADIIVETGGPGTMEQSLRAVSEGGNISAVGILTAGSSSDDSETNKSQTSSVGLQLIGRNAAIKGINIGPKDRTEEMLAFYADHRLHPQVGKTFAFEDAAAALESLKSGDHFGKVVIAINHFRGRK
ncbi:hypothetical protein N3K66_004103 [Trichothecium roseum]|uniref:Uncharacterized protein n=1 Tax=Trichothecium roseum TaxID=47278 RepID=A0ACC0V2Z3_9HYPO|nr:hypothetical protein N3K66_004103 [Trichothecium roseum]